MGKIKIIAVDDEIIILNIIKMLLSSADFEVTTCNSAKECLESMEKDAYDVAILDIMMPEMGGHELCKIIRKKYQSTLIIFLTSTADDDTLKKSFEIGGFDFIEKPVHKVELISRIKNAIRIKDSEDRLKIAMQELSLKNEILKGITIMDGLTQLYNHRYITEQLFLRCEEARRYFHCLSIMMIDIDYLKKINDMYGHLFGDEVLTTVAKVFRSNLRKTDLSGRYGGEEFLIILPNTSLENAVNVAKNLRSKIESVSFENVKDFKLTISIGVASAVDTDFDSKELIRKADKLLYKAKTNGRNRVEYSLK